MSGSSDEEQLRFAIEKRRCLFTFNRGDFARLHRELLASKRHHFGIIVSPQAPLGAVVRLLARVLSARVEEDLRDQLLWAHPHGSEQNR